MTQITISHLAFVDEVRTAFENNKILETYRDNYDQLIALRMGEDRDCIEVYELGGRIANFVQQLDPAPNPEKEVMRFAYEMENQLRVNKHKGGWSQEHHEFLNKQLHRNLSTLENELSKDDKDKREITIRCANIANYAMMIADNYGEGI